MKVTPALVEATAAAAREVLDAITLKDGNDKFHRKVARKPKIGSESTWFLIIVDNI